jgi:hypothetical protein
MNKIKYVGPYLQVTAEGYTFTRHVPVSVSPMAAEKLLRSKQMNGDVVFVAHDTAPVVVDASEPALASAEA